MQTKSARGREAESSDESGEDSQRGESLAEFFRSSGPIANSASKQSLGSMSNVKVPSRLSQASGLTESATDISATKPKRSSANTASLQPRKSKLKSRDELSDTDDDTYTKGSSLAEFLSSTGPPEKPAQKPAAHKKSFLNFSQSIDNITPKILSKSSLSKPVQPAKTAGVNHLSDFLQAISNEESIYVSQVSLTNKFTHIQKPVTALEDPRSPLSTRDDARTEQLVSKGPVNRSTNSNVLMKKSTSGLNINAIPNFFNDDSFASLPTFKADTALKAPLVLIALPLASLALGKIVKELTTMDSDYKKVFVAPTEQELPMMSKKQRGYACASCQTGEQDVETETASTMSPSIDYNTKDVDIETNSSDSSNESDKMVLETPRSGAVQVLADVHLLEGRAVSIMAAKDGPNDTIASTTDTTQSLELEGNSECCSSFSGDALKKLQLHVSTKQNAKPTLSIIMPLVGGTAYENKLLNEIDQLRIELAKEKQKREKVDLDRRVMHFQYDRIIRLTHIKVIGKINGERLADYESK